MGNHLDYIPEVDKDQQIRKLRDALVECTILLTVGASEPATDKAMRVKMSNQINENMKLI